MYTNHPFFLIDSCVFTAGKNKLMSKLKRRTRIHVHTLRIAVWWRHFKKWPIRIRPW